MTSLLPNTPEDEVLLAASLPKAEARKLQRRAEGGSLLRLWKGIYLQPVATKDQIASVVRRNWSRIAGAIVPGGVVSHLSAMRGGVLASGELFLSHPTAFNRKLTLPGLVLRIVSGPGPLPGDLPMGATGLHYAGRARMLLENTGRKSRLRASPEELEEFLVSVLNASGEKALNDIRDQAAALAPALHAETAAAQLRGIIATLLGTHAKGELRTRSGIAVANGAPADRERLARFELLAAHLRLVPLLHVDSDIAGVARHNHAFIESYFSNYVEGTKCAGHLPRAHDLRAPSPKDWRAPSITPFSCRKCILSTMATGACRAS